MRQKYWHVLQDDIIFLVLSLWLLASDNTYYLLQYRVTIIHLVNLLPPFIIASSPFAHTAFPPVFVLFKQLLFLLVQPFVGSFPPVFSQCVNDILRFVVFELLYIAIDIHVCRSIVPLDMLIYGRPCLTLLFELCVLVPFNEIRFFLMSLFYIKECAKKC